MTVNCQTRRRFLGLYISYKPNNILKFKKSTLLSADRLSIVKYRNLKSVSATVFVITIAPKSSATHNTFSNATTSAMASEDIANSFSMSRSLDALDNLLLPSPILTAADIQCTLSSGDIPIFLFDEAYILEDPAREVITPCVPEDISCIPVDFQSGAIDMLESMTPAPDECHKVIGINAVMVSSLRRPRSSTTDSQKERHRNVSLRHPPPPPPSNLTVLLSLEKPADENPVTPKNRITFPGFSPASMTEITPDDERIMRGAPSPTSPTESCQGRRRNGSHKSRSSDPWGISGSMAIPIDDSRRRLSPHRADRSDRSQSPRRSKSSRAPSPLRAQTAPKLTESSPLQHEYGDDSAHRKEGYRSEGARPTTTASPPTFKLLVPQDDYSWLQHMVIDFLIDQEGFRSASPKFKFAGMTHLRGVVDGKRMPRALFRPVGKQSFHFHYAPFDGPPVLRRVTTNGLDTHDYVSRQALLTLRANGVYFVQGYEVSVAAESVKLEWRFEYLVDERRSDTSRKFAEGDKSFSPITFSCSPELLLPQQGKRINVVHVLKKNVASKLTAEKLQPPAAPSRANPSVNASPKESPIPSKLNLNNASPLPMADTSSPSKKLPWGIHRRGQSHQQQATAVPTSERENIPLPERSTASRTEESYYHQRRRTSSARGSYFVGSPEKILPGTSPTSSLAGIAVYESETESYVRK